MAGLVIRRATGDLTFQPNGTVIDSTNAEMGKWSCKVDRANPANKLVFAPNGGTEELIPVKFAFETAPDKRNQLTVSTTGASPSSFTFEGRIVVNYEDDMTYEVWQDNRITGTVLTVVGTISWDFEKKKIDIAFPDRSSTSITGFNLKDRIWQHWRNPEAVSEGTEGKPNMVGDEVRFYTITTNSFGDMQADMAWHGSWAVEDATVFFVAHNSLEGAASTTRFKVTGRIKAVSGGLQVEYGNAANPNVGLLIKGEVTWSGDKGQNWNIKVGYSGKKLEATVTGSQTINLSNNRKIELKGDMSIVAERGAPLRIKMGVRAEYRFDRATGYLVFTAAYQNGGGGYSLQLEGELIISNWKVTFKIKYDSTRSGSAWSIALGAANTDADLKNSVSLLITRSSSGHISIQANVSIQFLWIDGELVALPS